MGDAIRAAGGDICESVELFDLFRGARCRPITGRWRSTSIYRDPRARPTPTAAKTLTDEEVDRKHDQVAQAVKQKFGAILRE